MVGISISQACVPFRTNMTPDHNEGSPGVRLTNIPSGHDCFSPVLQRPLEPARDGTEPREARTIRPGAAVSAEKGGSPCVSTPYHKEELSRTNNNDSIRKEV